MKAHPNVEYEQILKGAELASNRVRTVSYLLIAAFLVACWAIIAFVVLVLV
jgi:hypothetical protein